MCRKCAACDSLIVDTCHMGLTEVVTPLHENGAIIGYLMYGQFTNRNDGAAFIETVTSNGKKYGISTENFERNLRLVQYKDDDEITSISEIISTFAMYIYLEHIVSCKKDGMASRILEYIDNNLDKDLSNEVLSKMCYLHPNHFIRFFKSKTNRTPASYVRQCRLETAKRLLENPDLRITEVASKVGIDDISLFSKQFKMFFSISPREYRKYYQFHLQTAEKQVEDDDICPEYP